MCSFNVSNEGRMQSVYLPDEDNEIKAVKLQLDLLFCSVMCIFNFSYCSKKVKNCTKEEA